MNEQSLESLRRELSLAVDSFEDRDDLQRRIATLLSQNIMNSPEHALAHRYTIPKLDPLRSLGDNLDQYLGLKIPGMSGHLTKTKTILTGTSSTADRIQCLLSGSMIRLAETTGSAYTTSDTHLRGTNTSDLTGADVGVPVICRRVTMISSPGSVTTGSALGAIAPTENSSGDLFSEPDTAIGSQINETGSFGLYPGGTAVTVCDTSLLGQNVQPPPVRVFVESSDAGHTLTGSYLTLVNNLTRNKRAMLVRGTLTYTMQCSAGTAGVITVRIRATKNDGRGDYDRFVNHEFDASTGKIHFSGSIPLSADVLRTPSASNNTFICTAFKDVSFDVKCSAGTVTVDNFDCSYTGTVIERSEGAILLRQSGAVGVCPSISFFIEEWKVSDQDARGHIAHSNRGYAPMELLSFVSERPAVQHGASL